MDLNITILTVVTITITKDLSSHLSLSLSLRFTPYDFLSRCKFNTTRQPMVEFYLLTFPRFPLRKKEHKSYFGKNRTHDFLTRRCAGCLLNHTGDELWAFLSLVLPVTFGHTTAYSPGLAFSAAIHFAMKKKSPLVLPSRKYPVHSFSWHPPHSPRPPPILRTSRTSAVVSYPPAAVV